MSLLLHLCDDHTHQWRHRLTKVKGLPKDTELTPPVLPTGPHCGLQSSLA